MEKQAKDRGRSETKEAGRTRRGSRDRERSKSSSRSKAEGKRKNDGNKKTIKEGMVEAVANKAKAMIGIPTREEQSKMSIKIKKEMIEVQNKTPKKTKMKQTTIQGTIVDLTTPPQKRKKERNKKYTRKRIRE